MIDVSLFLRLGVEERVRQGVAESPWQNVKWGLVLGSAAFSQRVREGLAAGREMGAKRSLRERRTFENVVAVVERQSGEAWESFRDRHGDKRRDLVLWVARRCTGLTLAELGRKRAGWTMALSQWPCAESSTPALKTHILRSLEQQSKANVISCDVTLMPFPYAVRCRRHLGFYVATAP